MNEMQSFVANFQSAKLMQPSNRALDNPTCLAQATAMCGTPPCQIWGDAQCTKRLAVGGGIVSTVTLDPMRALFGTSTPTRERRDRRDQRKQLGYIMGIGRRERRRERDAPGVADKVVFAARFAPISGIGAGFFPPCIARTEELSTIVRDHSICSAACNRVSSTRCSLTHTPARCQLTKRRQQLTPEPHPISSGRAVHGMPVRNTNKMPVSACRWVIGLRPGCMRRRRFSWGNSGSISSHSASSRIGFDMNLLPLRESTHVKNYATIQKSTSPQLSF